MKHLQKLVTIVLAFVLALSLSLTALAEEDYGQEVTGEGNLFQNNEAQTTMKPRLHSASLQYRQIFLQQFLSMSLLQSNAMVILFVQGAMQLPIRALKFFMFRISA